MPEDALVGQNTLCFHAEVHPTPVAPVDAGLGAGQTTIEASPVVLTAPVVCFTVATVVFLYPPDAEDDNHVGLPP